jgi:hypothetical protein
MKSPRFSVRKLDRLNQRSSNLGAFEINKTSPNHKLYRALLATTIIASSQFLAALSVTANPAPTPERPNPLLPTRIILNGSFEQPKVTNWNSSQLSSTTGGASENVAGGNIREAYNETTTNQDAKPMIWRSTETGGTRTQYGYSDAIEVWRGTPGNGGQTQLSITDRLTPTETRQYAELNGSANASLYQDLCVIPNENIGWSLEHAARKKRSDTDLNIMQVSITDPIGWANSKTPDLTQVGAYYSTKVGDTLTETKPFISTKYIDGWKAYSGSWTSTNTSPKLLRFAFGAIQGSDGNTTYGNFIDNVQLSLSPLIDFLPTAGDNVNLASTTEGNSTNYYYLSLRINGRMNAGGSVKIRLSGLNALRSFRLGDVLKGSTTVAGMNATASSEFITLNIPPGTYDPNMPSDYIHIPIDFSDKVDQPNDNLTFTLQEVVTGNLAIASTRCSTDKISVETLLIDDDYRFQKRVELPIRIAAN